MKKLYSLCSHVVNYFLLIIYFLFCNYILAFGQTQTIAITGPSSTSGPVILTVQINPPNDCSVQLLPASLTIQTTNTQQFTATTAGCTPSTVTWTVNGVLGGDATHGTVSVGGLYTAPNAVPGPATVTVTATSVANNARTASASVTIAPPTPPCSVSIVPTSASVNTGATQQFTATTQTCTPSTVHWQVNSITGGNSTIGTISNTGLYTAPSVLPSPNTVTISAVSDQDNTTHANAAVTLNASLSCSIGITPQIVTLFVTNTQQFTASTSNCTPNTATWQVNGIVGGNSTIGTVSVSGLYTAPASVPSPSSVNVTAISVADATKTATAQVTISTAAANLDELYSGPGNTWLGSTTDNGANLPTTSYLTSRVATPSPGVLHNGLTTLSAVQSAVNNAACGDIIEIPAGTDLGIGNLTLPSKICDDSHYIWIRTSAVTGNNWPTEGTRITPCQANKAAIPNRTAYPCSSPQSLMFKITAALGNNCVTYNGDHYKITGMECTRVSNPGIVFILINVPLTSNPSLQNHLILEQDYIHGLNQDGHFPLNSSTATDLQHAIFVGQMRFFALKDSWVDDAYCTVICNDAQTISGGFGSVTNSNWGVYKIVNNHLSSSTEGILFGGSSGPALTPGGCTIIPFTCNKDVPSDGEVRMNYFYKPLTWNGNTSNVAGSGWPVEKNGFEMKNGNRWLFEGNTIENTWYHAQVGYTWSVAPVNQQSGGGLPTCPTCGVWDFVYRYNYGYNVSYGFAAYAFIPAGCPTCLPIGGFNIVFRDNLIDHVTLGQLCNPGTLCSAADAWEFIVNPDTNNTGRLKLNSLIVIHNGITQAVRGDGFMGGGVGTTQMNNWVFQNNYFPFGNFGVIPLGGSACDAGLTNNNNWFGLLTNCVATWTADHNIQLAFIGGNPGTTNNRWPTDGKGAGNFFCNKSSLCWNGTSFTTAAGFTNFNNGDSSFNPSNYIFQGSSPFHNAGSDGKDIGPDINTMINTLGVRY